MSQVSDVVMAQAKAWMPPVELDVFSKSAWKDVEHYMPGDVKEAFARHRRDTREATNGRVRGEFWPMPAVILAHLEQMNQERQRISGGKAKCRNPECSSGWVTAYTKPVGYEGKALKYYVKRCAMCH